MAITTNNQGTNLGKRLVKDTAVTNAVAPVGHGPRSSCNLLMNSIAYFRPSGVFPHITCIIMS